jgi:hypothetical protein
MIESVFAVLGLLVCAGLLLRMALRPAQQQRWDHFWRRRLQGLQVAGRWLRRQWQLLRSSGGARREAERAIERARGGKPDVDRDGNVIRPRSFRKSGSRKPPLH